MPENHDPLIAALVADLKPSPPLRQPRGMVLVLAALSAGIAAILALFGPRPDLMLGEPNGLVMVSIGLFLVLALASSWAVVDQARPSVGLRREGWGWTALMAAVLPLSAVLLLASDAWRGRGLQIDDSWHCMGEGLLAGSATALVLILWLRRGAPSSPRRAGLLTGVAAGSAGICAVALSCQASDMVHIGVWHAMTVVIAGVGGRLFIPRLIAW